MKNSYYPRKTRFLTRQKHTKKSKPQIKLCTEKPEVKLENLIRLNKISANYENSIVKLEESQKQHYQNRVRAIGH